MPPSEIVTLTRTCPVTGERFQIAQADLDILSLVSPTFGGKKFEIPLPTLSPKARHQRRLSFRNERHLYKGTCAKTGKSVISMYRPGSRYQAYDQSTWWGDSWSPFDFGRDFDFTRPFFEQFAELQREVPRPALLTTGMENSEYTNYSSYLKDCYLTFESTASEKVLYWWNLQEVRNCCDVTTCLSCESCYDCTNCIRGYGLVSCFQCEDCRDCFECVDCTGCANCIGCTGVRNGKFLAFNSPVSEEEFTQIRERYLKREGAMMEKIRQIRSSHHALTKFSNCENCTGNVLVSCKDAYECFDSLEIANSRYVRNASLVTDSMDLESTPGPVARSYEVNGAMDCDRVLFSMGSWGANIFYGDLCVGKNLFGCVGFHSNESYCVFNKQYTKEEYEALVPRIIEHMVKTGEWGEFFPSSISPFGYNETAAPEYYPLTREEAIKKGFGWSDYEPPFPKVEKTIPAAKLPSDIAQVPDDILNWAIECEVTKKPFRIIKQELEFYRKHHLPIPKRHPDQRHLERMVLRNP